MTAEAPLRITQHTDLGPDPEPLTRERFQRIVDGAERRLAVAARSEAPGVCPLERAQGRALACRGRSCVYYDVPGVRGVCAVAGWTGSAGPGRRLADWFIARRSEASAPHATSKQQDQSEEVGR